MPKAVIYHAYGDATVLRIEDVPLPEPGPRQVRIRVHAASLNMFDAKRRSGAMAGGKPLAHPVVIGLDLAGVVDAVGDEVTDFAVGDRVAGNAAGGAAAEFALGNTKDIAALPDAVGFSVGAGIPVVGRTAIRVLALVKVAAGQTLLLHAATGGVGVFATQLALQQGIRVIGTTSAANAEFLAGLGATPVQYGAGWVERVRAITDQPLDGVVDAAGHGVVAESLPLVRAGATIVTIVDFDAHGPGVVTSSGQEPGFENSLAQAIDAVASGRVHLPVQREFPLADAVAAYQLLETGHTRGKIVLTVD